MISTLTSDANLNEVLRPFMISLSELQALCVETIGESD